MALVVALALLAGLVVVALQPAAAEAQGPAFEEQYDLDLGGRPEPEPQAPRAPAPPPASPEETPQPAPEPAEPEPIRTGPPPQMLVPARGVGASAGELPVGGYPLTPFAALLLACLAGGLVIRTGLAVHDRVGKRRG